MATVKEIMQKYLDATYDELVEVAKSALLKLTPVFDEADGEGQGARFIVPVICAAIAADGRFSKLECQFVNDVLGADFSYEDLLATVRLYAGDRCAEIVDKICDVCSAPLKTEFLSLCLCIFAVDKTMSRGEAAFFVKLLA
jgi:hypothetical protein